MKVVSYYTVDDGKVKVKDKGAGNLYEYDYVPGMELVYLSSAEHRYGKVYTNHRVSLEYPGRLVTEEGMTFYLWRFMPLDMYDAILGNAPMKKQAAKRKPRIKKDKPSNLRRLLNAAPEPGGICSYALEFLHADGTRRQVINPNTACHASINRYPYRNEGKEKGAVLSQLVLKLSYKLDTTMDYKPWLKWYLKDSPFSQFIKPTTVHNAVKHGILIDCDKANAEVAAWVACTSRWLYEHRKRIPLFNEFLKIKGVTPNAAFVAANTLTKNEQGYSLWFNTAMHDSFDSRISLKNLSSVFTEGKVRDNGRAVLSKDIVREYKYISPVYCVDGRGFGGGGVTLYDSIKKMPYIAKVKSNYSIYDVIEHKDIDKLLHWLVTIVG